ncbi:MAG: hypothetical protein LBR26_09585 [Prevotella sp.]|jgi:hypothetical protein|nr:hypothetical protein [Prevotella sp.]
METTNLKHDTDAIIEDLLFQTGGKELLNDLRELHVSYLEQCLSAALRDSGRDDVLCHENALDHSYKLGLVIRMFEKLQENEQKK